MNRNFSLVVASLFFWGIGEGLFIYFQPIYLQELGADPVLIGTLLGGMGIVMALAQIPSGILADRYGARSIMLVSWIIGTLAGVLMAVARSLPMFAVGLLLYGASGFSIAPMNSYLTSVRGRLSIGRALTLASGMYHLGAVLGPITGGQIAEKLGFRTVYLISTIIFIISSVLVYFVEKNPPAHHEDQHTATKRTPHKNPLFMAFLGVTFITMFVLYLPQPFTPNFLQNQQGYNSATIGLLGAFGSLGNALTSLFLGSLQPITGMAIGQVFVLLFAGLYLKGQSTFLFGLGFFFFGGYRLCRAMVLAFARPLVHPAETGLAYGMLETANSVAIILAPVLAGFLYARSPQLIYKITLIAILPVLVITLLGLPAIQKRSQRKLHENQG